MKKYKLNGEYTTVTEYATAEKITRKGVWIRLKSKKKKLESLMVGKQLLIKIK